MAVEKEAAATPHKLETVAVTVPVVAPDGQVTVMVFKPLAVVPGAPVLEKAVQS